MLFHNPISGYFNFHQFEFDKTLFTVKSCKLIIITTINSGFQREYYYNKILEANTDRSNFYSYRLKNSILRGKVLVKFLIIIQSSKSN